MEAEIKEALTALLEGTRKSDRQAISDAMARLDTLLERNRAGLHPQLTHFLERRSYAKAMMFLGGDTDIPAGACGGKA